MVIKVTETMGSKIIADSYHLNDRKELLSDT